MKRNMSNADRWIRFSIALVFSILFYTNIISGAIGITLIAVSVIFLLTSLVSWCPIYAVFGWKTCRTE